MQRRRQRTLAPCELFVLVAPAASAAGLKPRAACSLQSAKSVQFNGFYGQRKAAYGNRRAAAAPRFRAGSTHGYRRFVVACEAEDAPATFEGRTFDADAAVAAERPATPPLSNDAKFSKEELESPAPPGEPGADEGSPSPDPSGSGEEKSGGSSDADDGVIYSPWSIGYAFGYRPAPSSVRTRGSLRKDNVVPRTNTEEWLKNILDIPKSSVLKRIQGQVLSITGVAVVVYLVHAFVRPWRAFSAVPHSLLATALGLLLVFRTNSAWSHYTEARKSVGQVVNTCRNLARQAVWYMRTANSKREMRYVRDRIVKYSIAFIVALKEHLLERRNLDRLRRILLNREVDDIVAAGHMPLFVAEQLSACLARASELGLPHHVHESMDHLIDGLLNECGACERIIKTPIPLSYSRHCSRFLTLWCATLPFVLVRDLGWAIIPVTAMLTYAVVGIEEIGHQVEEPFTTPFSRIPMPALADTVETDLMEMLAHHRQLEESAAPDSPGNLHESYIVGGGA